MAIGTPQYTESNLSGTLNNSISTTSTTILCTLVDRITGLARVPQSNTKLWVIDKGTEAYPNRKYELILAGTVSTDVNNVTTLGTCIRGLPFFGTGLTATGIPYEHVAGAEIGVADSHLLWNLLTAILDGTASIPGLKLGNRPTFELAGTLGLRIFADATARDAAITVPQNGDTCFLTSTGTPQWYGGGAWNDFGTGTTPNGSTAVAGKYQAATVVNQIAHTSVGSTGSLLVPQVGNLITVSAGAGDAGKLAITDGTGRFDASLIPTNIQLASIQQSFTFGEDIDGTTTPVAVYLKAADSKVYKTDSTSTESTFKFVGFTKVSTVTNASGLVITGGTVTGFTGLTSDSSYYLTNTPGTISTTAGTNVYEIATAISTTSLLIKLGTKIAIGTNSYVTTTSGTQNDVITTGFKPKLIEIDYYLQGHGSDTGSAAYARETGKLLYQGTTQVGKVVYGTGSGGSDQAAVTSMSMLVANLTSSTAPAQGQNLATGNGIIITLNVPTITDTGFTIRTVAAADGVNTSNGRTISLYRAIA